MKCLRVTRFRVSIMEARIQMKFLNHIQTLIQKWSQLFWWKSMQPFSPFEKHSKNGISYCVIQQLMCLSSCYLALTEENGTGFDRHSHLLWVCREDFVHVNGSEPDWPFSCTLQDKGHRCRNLWIWWPDGKFGISRQAWTTAHNTACSKTMLQQ